MKQTQTTRGISYGVLSSQGEVMSSAEDKVICETEPGNPKQFIAPSSRVRYTNPDTCVTKRAIRMRRNALLKKGGSLTAEATEFTALEYLESSGTQYIETQIEVDSTWGAKVEWEMTHVSDYANVLSGTNTDIGGHVLNEGGFSVPYWYGVDTKFLAVFMSNGLLYYTLDEEAKTGVRYSSEMNFCNSRYIKLNTESLGVIPETVRSFLCNNPILFGSSRNGTPLGFAGLIGKVFRVQISKGTTLKMYLIPVLNENGEPGMYDKVSKRFFGNHGTGSFGYGFKGQGVSRSYSLRNQCVVPPSGVYSRMVGENVPEVLADTEELSGDGWMWFANTAEAYAHFGIMPEEKKNL